MQNAAPIIAIVGRPNVGKSTLFNRYAGAKRALQSDTPGLTRDRVITECEAAGRRILLVDTAGMDFGARAEIERAALAQAQMAVQNADAILFVADGRQGLTAEDSELAAVLRRAGKPLLLAVNKMDNPAQNQNALEFHALGFKSVRAISAEHGHGAWDALEELAAQLPPPAEDQNADEEAGRGGLRVALAGRPNVGKSALFNRLIGDERSIVSATPGATRDAIDVQIQSGAQRFTFVDTAGLRRAAKRGQAVERGSAFMTLRALNRAHVALVLADAGRGFTEQDARLFSMAQERGCAAALIINKWDLVEGAPDAAREFMRELERRLHGAPPPMLRLSALTGRGVKAVLPLARKLGAATERRIPTAELNRWLRESCALHEPAMAARGARRRPIKFYYAVQTAAAPPAFALFCSAPRAVQAHYLRFLEKQLRARFAFQGVPLRLQLRRRNSAGAGER